MFCVPVHLAHHSAGRVCVCLPVTERGQVWSDLYSVAWCWTQMWLSFSALRITELREPPEGSLDASDLTRNEHRSRVRGNLVTWRFWILCLSVSVTVTNNTGTINL